MANMRERVIEAFGRDGRLTQYALAQRLWPQDQYPNAWRYASHGGPPGWVRTWGAAVKRYGFQETFDQRLRCWIVYRPSRAPQPPRHTGDRG